MSLSSSSSGSIAARKASDTFVQMRRQMDDLQRQMATGQKADTYGGLGLERRTALDARGKIASLEGYESTIQSGQLRVSVMSKGAERLSQIALQTRSDIVVPQFDLGADGRTTAQRNAESRFREVVDLLNSDVDGRYLFSGRSTTTEPVEAFDVILNGGSGRAGLKQILTERRSANLGADSLGRTTIATNAGLQRIDLTKNNAIPFGFSVTAMTHNLTGSATPVALTSGTSTGFRFTLGAQPNAGEKLNITLTMPNGAAQSFSLTARAATDAPAPDTFEIGASATNTFTNIDAALRAKVAELAAGPLASYAVQAAAANFFASSISSPPQRVPAPADSATTLVVGTATDTVFWYKGEDDGSPDRNTALLRVDKTQTVAIGSRANEPALANLLAQLGILLSGSFTNTVADQKRYNTLNTDVLAGLDQTNTTQSLQTMTVEIGTATALMNDTRTRHVAMRTVLTDTIGDVENASMEEVAASLLALQTRMQASYQTTSILSRLNLGNFL
jgi:flagellar hook-associated protein 3 FlgL